MFNGKRGDFRFVSVDGNRNTELLFEPLQYRNQTPQFFGRGDSYTSRLGGFGANIQNVSAQSFQFNRTRYSKFGIIVQAITGERIGSKV